MPQVQKFDNIRTHSELSIQQCHTNLNLKMLLAYQWLLMSVIGVERGGITKEHEETFGLWSLDENNDHIWSISWLWWWHLVVYICWTYQIAQSKYMQFIVCELYFNRMVKNAFLSGREKSQVIATMLGIMHTLYLIFSAFKSLDEQPFLVYY